MKLGCLPYLNVKPLVYTLEHGKLPKGWELVYAPPAELARMLVSREIAAAPVSSFACFENPRFRTCPGICIAADGPVKSVLMLSKVDPSLVRSVALDTGSLSGANMLKIVLHERYGLRPEFFRLPPDPVDSMLARCDSAMVIGNPAMLCNKEGLHVLDLGDEWHRLTGLPAVFALWAGLDINADLVEVLQEAKAAGMARLDEIAAEASPSLGLPFDTCLDYLSRTMVYDLGERETAGLQAFRERAAAHGLLSEAAEAASR